MQQSRRGRRAVRGAGRRSAATPEPVPPADAGPRSRETLRGRERGERADMRAHRPRRRRSSSRCCWSPRASLFTVDQRQNAIVFQLGEVKDVITKPGPAFQVAADPERAPVRHAHPHATTTPSRCASSPRRRSRCWWIPSSSGASSTSSSTTSRCRATRLQRADAPDADHLRRAARRVRQAHRARRGLGRARQDHGQRCARRPTRTCAAIGVEIVDVRLKRVDLPQEVSESVYRRMEAERKRIANELRSHGRRRGRDDPRRRRPPARGDPGRGLPRRAAHQGRGRRARGGDLRARVLGERRSSTPSTAAWRPTAPRFRGQQRPAAARAEFGLLPYLKDPAARPAPRDDAPWRPRSSWPSP